MSAALSLPASMVELRDPLPQYRFGVFELAGEPLELRKNGRRIKVRPQSLKLLRLLVERHGTTVPRDAIQAAIWSADVFVDVEQGVNHCIKELRAALRDDAESPRFIQTIPRQGYRFIAPVEAVSQSSDTGPVPPLVLPGAVRAASRAGRAVWIWGALTAAIVGAAIAVIATRTQRPSRPSTTSLTVAVLPFGVDGQTPPYLGLSFADAIIAGLARKGAVTVRPIAAVMRYESSPATVAEAAQALGVDFVVTGEISRDGDTSRVGFAVTRSTDSAAIASDTISGPAEGFEALEAALIERVARALDVPSSSRIGQARASDPNAHRAYLEGRYRLARLTGEDTLAAVAAFERALALDAGYAPAHAGLAIASAQMYIRFGSQADVGMWKTRAERHAAHALEIDPQRAEAHEALAAVARYTEFDWDRVVEQSFAAVRLHPGLDLPHYYVAAALQHVGRFDLVEDEIVAGLEANPWNLAEAYRLRGITALWSGRFADARTELERVRQLAARPVSDPHLAAALYYGGDAAAAEAMLDGLTGSAQAEQRAAALLASIVAARGDGGRARALAERVESRAYHDHHVDYSLGATYAALGEVPAAMRWLRQAVKTGFVAYPWYQQDPLLESLRGTREFEAIVAEAKAVSDRVVAKVTAERRRRYF
jgi:DNA-binding winged helix-turn-helix (wHTH) protein/TolB-like protein